ncbi:hypothetical protein CMUS01_04953 [Colletotrichum musicola]|uniref:Uncharacterized protein n=1 Tax=Colletotrichum musicola TaxID=2175873 RepID=A0A8H6KV26_9PEZI|nr:hypothetical protein CMUS01_04953 [Colletotrichum musicola]
MALSGTLRSQEAVSAIWRPTERCYSPQPGALPVETRRWLLQLIRHEELAREDVETIGPEQTPLVADHGPIDASKRSLRVQQRE